MLPTLVSIGPFRLYSYGVFLTLALFVGLFWWWRMGRDEHLDETQLFDAAFLMIFTYFVAGRLAYALYSLGDSSVLSGFALFARPGLIHWAGIVGAFVILVLYSRFRRWHVYRALDVFVVALSVALVVSHVGAFLNGSNPGRAIGPVRVQYSGPVEPVFPVDLLGFVWFLVTFAIVSRVRRHFRFYQWYKGDGGTARDGLAFLVFSHLSGWYYLIRSFIDDVSAVLLGRPAMFWAGLLLIALSAILVYVFSGRRLRSESLLVRRRRVTRVGRGGGNL